VGEGVRSQESGVRRNEEEEEEGRRRRKKKEEERNFSPASCSLPLLRPAT
jgi:hypothetical protein